MWSRIRASNNRARLVEGRESEVVAGPGSSSICWIPMEDGQPRKWIPAPSTLRQPGRLRPTSDLLQRLGLIVIDEVCRRLH
jgi:hypothetical protein